MNAKNLAATVLSAMIFLSACKKDFIAETSQSLNGDVISSDATAANDVLETAAPVHTPVYYNVNSNVAGYWQTLPARYNSTTKKYPLIIFIHGIGELGSNLSRINCCGLPKHLASKTFPAKFYVNGAYHSFIVVSPQFKTRPSAAHIQSVIDHAKSKYRVDASRIYVTGLSMGGGSTFDFSVVYGQNAAAIVPVCAGTRPTTALAASVASKNLPVWTISSSHDAVVPIQWAKDWISWIDSRNQSIAPKTKLTVWSAETHNGTWGRAFNPTTKVDGYNIYEWMLLYKRGAGSAAPPAPTPSPVPTTGNKAPVAKAGDDRTIPLDWKYFPGLNAAFSSDADGWIKSFRWTKVSGPSSFWFSNPNGAQTKANGLVAGTYVFRVTVTDNKGAIAYDDVRITMTGAGGGSSNPGSGSAPIAKAGNDRSIPMSWKYFPTLNAAFSSDADGYIRSFKWTKLSGPSAYWFSNANTAQTKVNGLVAGTYVFRVAVTDNKGNVSYDDVRITMTNN